MAKRVIYICDSCGKEDSEGAALARHWLLLYVPIWIWVLTRISQVVEVGMVA